MRPFVFENPPLMDTPEGQLLAEYIGRQFQKASQSLGSISDESEVLVYGASIPGVGDVWTDLNATDFTGHQYAGVDGCVTTALSVKTNAIVTFGHNSVAYIWEGPQGVCLGLGGNYSAVSTDLVPIGTADHNILVNRDQADQHPQAAVTDLVGDQATQNGRLSSLESSQVIQDGRLDTLETHPPRVDNPHQVHHDQLPDVGSDPADPHPQYCREGFGGIVKTTDTNYGTVGSGSWTTIDNWDEGMVFSPNGVTQDVANSGLRVAAQGVYKVTGVIAISFTDTNQGRVFAVRLWNDTKSTAGRAVDYFVGRNQDGVNISQGALLVEIGVGEVNDLFQIQIAGSGDSFSNVAVIDALFSMTRHG